MNDVEESRCEDHGSIVPELCLGRKVQCGKTRVVAVEGGAAILLGPFPNLKITGKNIMKLESVLT